MTSLTPEKLTELAFSEQRYRRLFETARDGILLVNADTGKVEAANPYIGELLNRPVADMIGVYLWELGLLKDVLASKASFLELQQKKYIRYEDLPLETSGGHVVHVEFISNVYDEGDSKIIQCNIRDVSDRFEAQKTIKTYYRTVRTVSKCNAILVHSEDEGELSTGICQALVEEGGFAAIWIGTLNGSADSHVLLPLKSLGFDQSAAELGGTLCSETAKGTNPMVDAVVGDTKVIVHAMDSRAWPAGLQQTIRDEKYISAAIIPVHERHQVTGVLCVFSRKHNRFDKNTVSLLAELAADLGFGLADIRVRRAHAQNLDRLVKSFDEAIEAIAATTEMRDPYTAGHQKHVARLASTIAAEMNLPPEDQEMVRMAGVVHDVGKIQVPAEILSNPGKLSEAQFDIIKTHPRAGYDILKKISFRQPIAEIVHQHHERLDGSGYPQGLKGGDILPAAKILAVADVVEAMASHRPYRPGLGIEAALDEITKNKGRFYDPDAVDACLRLFSEKGYQLEAASG